MKINCFYYYLWKLFASDNYLWKLIVFDNNIWKLIASDNNLWKLNASDNCHLQNYISGMGKPQYSARLMTSYGNLLKCGAYHTIAKIHTCVWTRFTCNFL